MCVMRLGRPGSSFRPGRPVYPPGIYPATCRGMYPSHPPSTLAGPPMTPVLRRHVGRVPAEYVVRAIECESERTSSE